MDVRVVANQLLRLQPIVNVMCWNNVIEDEGQGQEIADLIRQGWVTHLQSELSNVWSLQSVSITYFPTAGPYTISYSFTSGPIVGGQSSHDLPAQAALVGSLQHVGPRPNRGRLYLGGWTEAHFEGGVFNSSARGHVEDMLNDWASGVTTGDGDVFLRIGRRDEDGPGYSASSPVEVVIARANPGAVRSRRVSIF